MIVLREFLLAVAGVVDLVFSVYVLILVARVLLTWVNPAPHNPIIRFIQLVTDPVLYRIQRLVPLQFAGIDFSPMVLLLALSFVQRLIVEVLRSFAHSF